MGHPGELVHVAAGPVPPQGGVREPGDTQPFSKRVDGQAADIGVEAPEPAAQRELGLRGQVGRSLLAAVVAVQHGVPGGRRIEALQKVMQKVIHR
ncbi:Uncharacterised protein [Mycobacteroides abscessus subsp. massiliense]|nr:Uncharacterised protein [Mycobacteroides abscessus subsp. massiliense]